MTPAVRTTAASSLRGARCYVSTVDTKMSGGATGFGDVQDANEIPTLKLYRDCMKLTYHLAAGGAKGEAMRQMVRMQFKAQMHVTDKAEIDRLKMLAVKGLQNYVIHESTTKAVQKKKDGEA